MTKADRCIVDSYNRAYKTKLSECYGTFSNKKYDAWEHCRDMMSRLGGQDIRIISHNGYQFTVGFKFEEDGHKYLMYISKSNYDGKKIRMD